MSNVIFIVFLFSSLQTFAQPGTLDTTFYDKGKYVGEIYSAEGMIHSMVIQPDNKILLAGDPYHGLSQDIEVQRLLPNGDPDSTFHFDGKFFFDFSNSPDFVSDICLQQDGKILVLGYSSIMSGVDIIVLRLNADGSLDNTFDGDGVRIINLPGNNYSTSIALQSNGKIIIVGYCDGSPDRGLIVRLNPNGSIDNSFDIDGIMDISGAENTLKKVKIQSDDKIVIIGRVLVAGYNQINFYRLNADGTFDSTFDTDGIATVIFVAGNSASPTDLFIQPDGKIVGCANSNSKIGICRINTNGVLDNTFDVDGIVLHQFKQGASFNISSNGILLYQSGKIVVAGRSVNSSSHDYAYLRLNVDGSLDNTFGTSGYTNQSFSMYSDNLSCAALTIDGKILAAGNANIYLSVITRLTSSGIPDNTFKSSGYLYLPSGNNGNSIYCMAISDDDKILLAGRTISLYSFSGTIDYNSHAIVRRLNANGYEDISFANKGTFSKIDEGDPVHGKAITIQADKKILIAEHKYNAIISDNEFEVIRLNANGSYDNTFNSSGTAVISGSGIVAPNQIKVQGDNKIIVVGSGHNGTNYDFAITRFNSDGTIDNSFDLDGKLLIAVGNMHDHLKDVVLMQDGKIVIGGQSEKGSFLPTSFTLVRLNTDGTLDNSFDGDGKLFLPSHSGNISDYLTSMDIQSDGKIIIGGYYLATSTTAKNSLVCRINPDGSLDNTFDSDGFLPLPISAGINEVLDVAVMPDNKILVLIYEPTTITTTLIMLNSNGSFNNTFDSDGKLPLYAGSFQGKSIGFNSTGNIIVGGTYDGNIAAVSVNTKYYSLLNINSANTCNVGDSINLTSSSINPSPITYSITGGTGVATISGSTLHILEPGTIIISASQPATNIYYSDNTSQVITGSNPTVTLSSFSAVCVNASLFALTGGSPAGGTYTGTGVSAGNFDPASAGAGSHTITYTYSNGAYTNTATSNILVNPLPTVTLSSFSAVCINVSAFALTGGAPLGGTYTGMGVSGGSFSSVTAGAGTHIITYSYTDGNTCTNTETSSITVNSLPTVTLGLFSDVCPNAPTFALSGGLPVGGSYSGTGVSAGNFTPTSAGAGTHSLTYSYSDGTCTNTANSDQIVLSVIDNSLTVSGATITANLATADYQWIECGNSNTIINGEIGQNFTPSLAGDYAVIVTVGFCSDTSACNTISFTGINNSAYNVGLSVFPNPGNGDFTISFNKEETFSLINNLGQTVQTIELNQSNNNSATVSAMGSGIYFLISNSNTLLKYKIVVAK